MNTPLISVIVPVYNVEGYIEQCIRSIQSQTYKNLEVIIVDDGSPDNSIVKAKSLTDGDPRFIYIQQENGGLSAARNTGLEHATGEYVTFIDSDDFLFEASIEMMYHGLKLSHAEISIGAFCRFDDVNFIFYDYGSFKFELLSPEELLERQDNQVLALRLMFWTAWGKLYKKELFADIRFPVGQCYEDAAISWKLFMKTQHACYLNQPLYVYRSNPSSISQNFKLEYNVHLEFLKERIVKMNEIGYPIQKSISLYRHHLRNHIQLCLDIGEMTEVASLENELERIESGHLDFLTSDE